MASREVGRKAASLQCIFLGDFRSAHSNMGLLDVKIQIARGSQWRGRNQRLERIKSAPITNPQSTPPSSSSSSNNGEQYPNASDSAEYMDVELHRAAASDVDNVDDFISILERVSTKKRYSLADIFRQVSPLGNTLLHVAASHQNEKITRLIAYHCPSMILKQNSDGDTAMHLAARSSDTARLAAATAGRGGDTYVVSTLLRFLEDLPIYEWVGDAGATPDDVILLRMRNNEGNTALHEALINGQQRCAFSLIVEDHAVSFFLNMEGESPLYLAVKAGYERIVSRMFALSDYKIRNKDEWLEGKSPLQAAITRRDKGLIDIILQNEPRFINLRDMDGRTPLHYAASMGYVEEVQYLIGKFSASPIERDNEGLFPIHLAAIEGHIQTVEMLLQHCPDPREMLSHNGQSILHVATNAEKHDVVSHILVNPALGCLINHRDFDGNTPLHLAAMNNNTKIISTMAWDRRMDLKIVNKEGLTAIDIAKRFIKGVGSNEKLILAALRAVRCPNPTG
ncbi:hypothetical protein Nepgr_000427 [Nepenthes gracilis]|uniref:Uncharacterized protein n=1 Tax=Nepenthes gracilis TaxID=150966 RepID=A0AAD3P3H4_NEPGR|nr:hypothetical protein Nepgr_000427 [Nepenthes gracilis]